MTIARSLTPYMRTDAAVSPTQIGWGTYGGFEGPMYLGKQKLQPEDTPVRNPPMAFRALAACAAAEGGTYDAVNMYDRGVCSVGLIQVIEGGGVLGVSDLLGEVMMADCRDAFHELYPAFTLTGYRLSRVDVLGVKGTAVRFLAPEENGGGVVDTEAASRTMFFGGPNVGRKGTWQDANIRRAKEWAACIASVFQHKGAIDVQRQFMSRRLMSYVMPSAMRLFKDPIGSADYPDMEFFRVLYLTFAINAPSLAARCLDHAFTRRRDFLGVIEVFVRCILVTGPAFYPDRMLKALASIHATGGSADGVIWRHVEEICRAYNDSGITVTRTQKALMKMGYDIGPSGADGIMGAKTKKALAAYAGIYQSQKTVNNDPIEVDADGLGEWALVTDMYKQLYRRTEGTGNDD